MFFFGSVCVVCVYVCLFIYIRHMCTLYIYNIIHYYYIIKYNIIYVILEFINIYVYTYNIYNAYMPLYMCIWMLQNLGQTYMQFCYLFFTHSSIFEIFPHAITTF